MAELFEAMVFAEAKVRVTFLRAFVSVTPSVLNVSVPSSVAVNSPFICLSDDTSMELTEVKSVPLTVIYHVRICVLLSA